MQTVEEGIKPGQKAAKDALKQTKDKIPEPEEARKQARSYADSAAQSTAKAVKDNARPTADQIEKEAIRPAQQAAEALPGQVKVALSSPHQVAIITILKFLAINCKIPQQIIDTFRVTFLYCTLEGTVLQTLPLRASIPDTL